MTNAEEAASLGHISAITLMIRVQSSPVDDRLSRAKKDRENCYDS